MKKLIILAAVLLVAGLAFGQTYNDRTIVPLCADYDLDSTSYIYVTTTGQSDLVLSGPRTRNVKITTVGSSTTVAAATATQAPFQGIIAGATGGGGDILQWNVAGLTTTRVITAKASDDSVTVDTAIDLSANPQTFSWRRLATGSTAADGWVPTAGFSVAKFSWQMKQSDGASIDVKVECKNTTAGADIEQIVTTNVTAYGCPGTGCQSTTINPQLWDQCRLGFKITTDSSDAGANLEKISAQFIGTK